MRDVRLHVMEIVKTLFCASTTHEAADVLVTHTNIRVDDQNGAKHGVLGERI